MNNGGPAFPRAGYESKYPTDKATPVDGMSLRDYFAAHAMVGLLSTDIAPASEGNPSLNDHINHAHVRDKSNNKWLALKAYAIADAMLASREKKQ